MKTIELQLFTFDELSEKAKEKAIRDWRNKGYDNQYYYDEIVGSVKAVAELFNLKFGRQYTDIKAGHIDDNILELSGVRLLKYILNNYGNKLFTPKYIKMIHRRVNWRQFVCEHGKGRNGEYTQIYSRTFKVNDGCPLTGICYDYDILQPVYDFLKKPEKQTTFADLISNIEHAIGKTFEDTEDWLNSDEFIISEIEAQDYEFTESGEIFNI